MVLGAVLGYFLSVVYNGFARPMSWLEAASGSLARLLVPIGTITGLEARGVQSLGLSRSHEMLNTINWSLLRVGRPVCLIFLVMCLS